MGIDINGVRLMIAAKKNGAKFDEMLTLGRQILNVYPLKLARLLKQHGLPNETFLRAGPECGVGDTFFEVLGAKKVSAMDNSDYEGAAFIHDLNRPVPDELKNRFDAVYDGGTLEHVFNFPVALQSCMEMVRPGGRLYMHTIANNQCGHGFYQFSPELFFRALSPENGFEIERVIMHVIGPYGRWREVNDPDKIGARVTLMYPTPVHMLIQARKTAVKPIFARMPFQSDYSVTWRKHADTQVDAAAKAAPKTITMDWPWLSKYLPGLARLLHVLRMGWMFFTEHSFRNRRFYRPVRKD